jgi:hypothetical protein
MPRPSVLPAIDWSAVFHSGLEFDQWLDQAESSEHAARMRADVEELELVDEALDYLGELMRNVYVVAIAEDWCGDVLRHVPALERIAKSCDKMQTRYISREQHPDVFARFLTNGGEAIPKFIFFNDQWVEYDNWGPMPCPYRRFIARGKACGDVASARRDVAKRYEDDPGRIFTFNELLDMVAMGTNEAY